MKQLRFIKNNDNYYDPHPDCKVANIFHKLIGDVIIQTDLKWIEELGYKILIQEDLVIRAPSGYSLTLSFFYSTLVTLCIGYREEPPGNHTYFNLDKDECHQIVEYLNKFLAHTEPQEVEEEPKKEPITAIHPELQITPDNHLMTKPFNQWLQMEFCDLYNSTGKYSFKDIYQYLTTCNENEYISFDSISQKFYPKADESKLLKVYPLKNKPFNYSELFNTYFMWYLKAYVKRLQKKYNLIEEHIHGEP